MRTLRRNEERRIKGRDLGSFRDRMSCTEEYSTGVAYSWFREVIQNSYDADATEIVIDISRNPDGSCAISAHDNGKGMSEKVFTDVFFAYGGTDKGGGGFAGGFGKAKELILLPWRSWSVVTSNGRETLRADSPQGWTTYNLERLNPQRKGTTVFIETWSDKEYIDGRRDPDAFRFRTSHALKFLQFCKMPKTKITIKENGKEVYSAIPNFGADRARVVIHNKSPERPDSRAIGKIYVVDTSSGYTRFFTRSRGLLLWKEEPDIHTGKKSYDVIFDLLLPDEVPIETILSSNRGSISNSYVNSEVRTFINGMIRDPIEQMRKSAPKRFFEFKGFGKASANVSEADIENLRKARAKFASSGAAAISVAGMADKPDIVTSTITDIISNVESVYEDAKIDSPIRINESITIAIVGDVVKSLNESKIAAAIEAFTFIPDYILTLDLDIQEDFKPHARFFPKTMTDEVRGLICAWTEICRLVLLKKASDKRYGVGFIFSNSTVAALHINKGNNYLVLNPYKSGDTLLNPRDPEDVKDMFASAVHEVTHLADGEMDHDLAFSSALTENIGITSTLFPLALRIAKAASSVSSVKQKDTVSESEVSEFREWEEQIMSGKSLKGAKISAQEKKIGELIKELAIEGASAKRIISLLPQEMRTPTMVSEIENLVESSKGARAPISVSPTAQAIVEKTLRNKAARLEEEIQVLKASKITEAILGKALRFNGTKRRLR